jgi:phosphoribosylformylglycinamidine cyclo-ligase
VDVAAGERAVALMRERLAAAGGATALADTGAQVLGGLGGFGAAVTLPPGMRAPVLISATDGVGTKTAIAAALRRYDTIGQDLVAMCADDVVCHGARPLFFLDYVAVGRVEPVDVADLVEGVARGCALAGCALVGGETAEHPGLLRADEFDVAGFCVGVVERDDLLDGTAARADDVVLGVAASGLHANGYSLVRSLLSEYQLELDQPYLGVVRRALGEAEEERVGIEEPEHVLATLGEVLLTPTRIYALDLLALRERLREVGDGLHGLAHVTGGGLPGNLPRAVGEGLGVEVDVRAWPVPSVHRLVAGLGGLDGAELRATLNCGLGMAVVVAPEAAELAMAELAARGHRAWVVGRVRPLEALGGARYREVGGDTT